MELNRPNALSVVKMRHFTTLFSYLLLLLLCFFPADVQALEGTMGSSKDQSSYANVDQFVPTHSSFDIAIAFEDSSSSGTVTHTMTVLESNVTTVYLDVRDGLTLTRAEFKTDQAADFVGDYVSVPMNITTPNPI
jgi:hypothetical protein